MRSDARFYKDINEFYEIALPFLLKKEVENGLQISILNSLKNNIEKYGKEAPILCTVSIDDEIKLVSLRTPPYNQILSYTDELKTIDVLIDALNKVKPGIPGILGFTEGAKRFSKLWCKRNGLKSKIVMNERIYKLESVAEDTLGNKKFIKATDTYENIILQWGRAFMLEALPDRAPEMIERSLKHFKTDINEGRIFLLFDNELPVSMARKAGKSPNGIAVNAVYTPPHLRRKGYATECVAKSSKLLLEEGNKYCFLFTDLSNPTSNSIYQKIGYRPIMDVDEYHFFK
ncbi:MAG: GNAT family N-acetyltransferase [Candidatus Lokiarchaeota archaeon]|nr:GNAT family N-acetyltransferase [Candidatus Lokiarchaeota archaeon]